MSIQPEIFAHQTFHPVPFCRPTDLSGRCHTDSAAVATTLRIDQNKALILDPATHAPQFYKLAAPQNPVGFH